METGQVDLFALKAVVEEVTTPATEIALNEAREMYRPLYGDDVANSIELGDEMEFPKPTEVLGRIGAQTAKQVIFQKVREAERENIFGEYNQRIGEVVSGAIKRFENGDIIIEIGRIEALLPRKEQSRAESYTPADRVRTVIKGVNRSAKGPQIVLSRTDPALLIKLFEQEVPEIYDGTVMIRGAVREAGDRAKVAVFSRERDVDPGGAGRGRGRPATRWRRRHAAGRRRRERRNGRRVRAPAALYARGHRRQDRPQAGRRRVRDPRGAGRRDRRAAVGDSRHRRQDRG